MLQLPSQRPRSVTVRRLLGLVCGVALGVTGPLAAQDSATARTARVTYVTGAAVYIDAGRDDGLREGAIVQIVRDGAIVATLKVAFLASHQASCEVVTAGPAIVPGDIARFTAAPAAPDTTVAVQVPRAPVNAARGTLRGRVGARYVMMRGVGGNGFTQPSLDVRADGRPSGGSPVVLAIDVRARRTVSTGAGALIDGHARAYQLSVAWSPPASGARVAVGRQIAPGSASVGIFDGVVAELRSPRWTAGVFSGTQPEPSRLEFATDVVEGGGYVQHNSAPGMSTRWSVTLGVTGSYQDAHANREFTFVQASLTTPRVSAFVTQEVDYYRPWKRSGGMPALSPTSTFATARLRMSATLDLHAGFDNRRNVLLYRDVVNPLTAFDDAFRQGVWLGAGLRLGRRYNVALDARQSSGGAAGRSASYTLSAGADRVARLPLTLRSRTTYYTNRQLDGWLQSLSLGGDVGERLHAELSGGARIEHDPLAIPDVRTITWVGADVDVSLGRRWYVMLSTDVERGGDNRSTFVQAGFSARF